MSITIEPDLLEQFDEMISARNLGNRSEIMRDLIREKLAEKVIDNGKVIGTVTLLYDHHKRQVSQKIASAGHIHHDSILSSMHIHLNDQYCLETIVLRGDSQSVHHLADHLIGMVGVLHGQFVALPLSNMGNDHND
jgi:CopG family nickel-responsive transcriptional regulator